MYSAKITETTMNAQQRSIFVEIEITEPEGTTFTDTMRFSATATEDAITKAIKKYVSELENAASLVTNITTGEVDLSEEEDIAEEETPEELAKNEWVRLWGEYTKAKAAMDALADAGIEATEEEVTQFETLKAWVAENRKPEYYQYIND